MQAIRVHPAPSGTTQYSPANPAPASAIKLDRDVPKPKITKPGELLIRVRASAVIRDMLTWPETYHREYTIPGNDVAGVVEEVHPDGGSKFNVGDEVFGMTSATRGASWAEFTIVQEHEIDLKSKKLSWEQAAALPLSGQTAYEALFDHAGVTMPTDGEILSTGVSKRWKKKILITGAAGGVGVYLVQLAFLAGLYVVAATSSNERNSKFLSELGANSTIEYSQLKAGGEDYDIIIDTVGGDVLIDAWKAVKAEGTLLSVDSSSYNFVEEHKKQGFFREDVKSLFFIVEGTAAGLQALAHFADIGRLQVFVQAVYPWTEAQAAYEKANGRLTGRGKIIITM